MVTRRILSLCVATITLLIGFSGCTKAPYDDHLHQWDDGIITKEPVCGTSGIKTFYCQCGKTKTEDIPATQDHIWDRGVPVGDQKIFTCFSCYEEKAETYTPTPASADLFIQKDIFSEDNYMQGFFIYDNDVHFDQDLEDYSYIMPVYLGNCYEIKFLSFPETLSVAYIKNNPYDLEDSDISAYSIDEWVVTQKRAPYSFSSTNFLFTPNSNGFLVMCTGTSQPQLFVGEQIIVTDTDSAGTYWKAPAQGSIYINEEGAMGDKNWGSEKFFNEMYEPVREKYPEYITRTLLGKDQSGKYNMYAYFYTPEDYKTTFFLASGMHGSEQPSYFALAKLMELIANADESDEQLWFLKNNVRFIVVPLINVWSASNTHSYENSTNTNLNSDFPGLSQKETQHVFGLLKKYVNEVDFLVDFHCASSTGANDLYQNFAIQAENAPVIFRTLNHLHHRQKELGYVKELRSMKYVPGVYIKSQTTLQGRTYHDFKISSITVEHFMSTPGFPDGFSAEGMTWAVEAFANVVIQNAYFYVDLANS